MSQARNPRRYSSVAIFLHWTIAALIAWNLVLGFRMHAATGLRQFNLFQLHKSIGISILLLSVGRLLWRIGHRPPPFASDMKAWEKTLAQFVHASLYSIMIFMPLTGWILVSTSSLNIPTLLFQVVPWPYLPGFHDLDSVAKSQLNAGFGWTHMVLAWGALALIALHLGGVLKHLLVDRAAAVESMMPNLPGHSQKEISA